MNTFALKSESKLTDRYQTTIPETVRKALHLNKRDKLLYTIQANGSVFISRAYVTESDPVLEGFLNFLAKDINKNPASLTTFSKELASHIQTLVTDVEVDLNSPLAEEDE